MNRTVIVVSGLPYTGKSWQLRRMLSLPGFEDGIVVQMDEIRVGLYGHRSDTDVTRSEHLFKNEKTRNTVLEKLVLGHRLVLTEDSQLTVAGHQQPFVDS